MLFRKTLHRLGCSSPPHFLSSSSHLSISDNGPHRPGGDHSHTPPLFPPSFTHKHTHTSTLSLSLCLSFYLSVSNNGAQQSKEDPVRRASAAGTAWPTGRRTCECIRAEFRACESWMGLLCPACVIGNFRCVGAEHERKSALWKRPFVYLADSMCT